MIIAAACFARSSPRFERWVLELPTIGRMVRDYRRGLGMPRKAKISAILTMVIFCGLSVGFFIEPLMIRITVALLVWLVSGMWAGGYPLVNRCSARFLQKRPEQLPHKLLLFSHFLQVIIKASLQF
jgi:uncharacterized membrane protein YbaN (DUF454 family)